MAPDRDRPAINYLLRYDKIVYYKRTFSTIQLIDLHVRNAGSWQLFELCGTKVWAVGSLTLPC